MKKPILKINKKNSENEEPISDLDDFDISYSCSPSHGPDNEKLYDLECDECHKHICWVDLLDESDLVDNYFFCNKCAKNVMAD